MKRLFSVFHLLRSVNLLFIALTQYLVQYTIIKPFLAQADVSPTLNDFYFFLLVISTVLVAAAGYIINDYFDVQIDEVNKPKRIYIDRIIHRRAALLLHQFLTGAGVMTALFVAWKAGNFKLGFIHAIVAAFLWFYSTGYKRRLLAGNIIVAFLTGFIIITVALYEKQLFYPGTTALVHASYSIFIILFFYFVFAFLISLARELVKDMEDIEGDRRFGCRTVPIVMGIPKSKRVVYAVLSVILLLMIYLQSIQVRGGDFVSAFMICTTLEFPLAITVYLLNKANSSKQFNAVSTLIKIVMLMGILSMMYFYFLNVKISWG